jgi:hypothetical protein
MVFQADGTTNFTRLSAGAAAASIGVLEYSACAQRGSEVGRLGQGGMALGDLHGIRVLAARGCADSRLSIREVMM